LKYADWLNTKGWVWAGEHWYHSPHYWWFYW